MDAQKKFLKAVMRSWWTKRICVAAAVASAVMIGVAAYFNGFFNGIHMVPKEASSRVTSLTNEELVAKWLRDREDKILGIEFAPREPEESDVRVKYQATASDGRVLTKERIFHFDARGFVHSVERVSFNDEESEVLAKALAEQIAAEPVFTGQVASANSFFPWGERAKLDESTAVVSAGPEPLTPSFVQAVRLTEAKTKDAAEAGKAEAVADAAPAAAEPAKNQVMAAALR